MAKKKKSFMTPKASRRKARKRLSTTSARVKKEFTYRGYTMEQLNTMPLWSDEEECIVSLLPSRARRSFGRGSVPAKRAFHGPSPPFKQQHGSNASPRHAHPSAIRRTPHRYSQRSAFR